MQLRWVKWIKWLSITDRLLVRPRSLSYDAAKNQLRHQRQQTLHLKVLLATRRVVDGLELKLAFSGHGKQTALEMSGSYHAGVQSCPELSIWISNTQTHEVKSSMNLN